jgi:lipoprotein signal peptidase
MLRRAALLLTVAVPLAGADLLHKAVGTTPHWAYHPRGAAWIALSAAVILACLALSRVPSVGIVAAAGLLAAGAAGNGIAAVAWERGIPNPIVWESGSHLAAFNLADVFTLVGIALLLVLLSSATIRNRERLFSRRLLDRERP